MGQDSNLVRFLMRSLGARSIIDGQTRLESCPTEAAARSPGLPPGSPVDPGLRPSRNLQRAVVEFSEESQKNAPNT